MNTLGPNQCLRVGMGVGGATPTKPREGVRGLDLDSVPADLEQYLVTVYRGVTPSHVVATAEGFDRGRLDMGDVDRQNPGGAGRTLAPRAIRREVEVYCSRRDLHGDPTTQSYLPAQHASYTKTNAAGYPTHMHDGHGGTYGEVFCHDGTPLCSVH